MTTNGRLGSFMVWGPPKAGVKFEGFQSKSQDKTLPQIFAQGCWYEVYHLTAGVDGKMSFPQVKHDLSSDTEPERVPDLAHVPLSGPRE